MKNGLIVSLIQTGGVHLIMYLHHQKNKKTEDILLGKKVTNSNDPAIQALQKAGWEPVDRLRVGFSGSEVPGILDQE